MKQVLCGLAATALAACAAEPPMQEPADAFGPPARTVAADLQDANGRILARATVTEIRAGLLVRIEGVQMAGGAYAVHLHTTGRCTPPDFQSAGPHWNPTGQQHGKNNPKGAHKGDLPNLTVNADGRGSFEATIQNASIAGGPSSLLDGDGAAVVIHASVDDYRTDPSGNSGNRVACGVFR